MSRHRDAELLTIPALAEIDWDFPERVAQSGIESIHPYPAKFVAELPRALLDTLPIPPRTAVLDPFCGGGTTLVECQRRGVPSVGIDLNPIACLMARVKTAPRPLDLKDTAADVVERARRASDVAIPPLPNLDHWFDRSIQHALAALTEAIDRAPATSRDALRLALSSIVVRVSKQESDTRYAAIDKNVTGNDVSVLFRRATFRLDDVLADREYSLAPADVFEADTLTLDPLHIGRPIGMIITSPPYPNAYEYWLYHKYRMYWLGFDPLAVKEREIGARAHFFKRNHHTKEDFARQMAKTFDLIRAVLVPGGYVSFVVGRSRIHGRDVDNARIVEDAAEGFDLVFSTERTISASRKSFNLSHANIKTENVLVLQRRMAVCA
ncbi:MAG: DNA methyltransferase [Spirochaetaceae bacterium]|nr:DNA methyltransferase [Spirochaetaceae bacterium]